MVYNNSVLMNYLKLKKIRFLDNKSLNNLDLSNILILFYNFDACMIFNILKFEFSHFLKSGM